MEKNELLTITLALMLALTVISFVSNSNINENEINHLTEQNKILKIDNLNLQTQINYLTEIKDLCIIDKSEKLIEINNLTNQIKVLERDRENLIKELGIEYQTQNKLKELIKQAKRERGLINPTYKQLEDFVRTDLTNKKEWAYKYDCTEFSNEFISNFANEGYFSCSTEIDFTKSLGGKTYGHHIVAINTTDKGLMYLEPQTDSLINPVFMKKTYNYCSAVDWDCKWNIGKISSCFDLI